MKWRGGRGPLGDPLSGIPSGGEARSDGAWTGLSPFFGFASKL